MLGNVLALELRHFDVKTITLMTGAVRTNFYRSMHHQNELTIPEGCLYAPVKDLVAEVVDGTFLKD